MVVVPAGSFMMGSPTTEEGRFDREDERKVSIAKSFAAGKFAVTFHEWDACVAASGCKWWAEDQGWGRGNLPVINVSWYDTQEYVAWLSRKTGKTYRLLSEAEREYVARAGTTTPFWWGTSISTSQANFDGKGTRYRSGQVGTVPVNSFEANPWGLYNVHGNVWEWVEDCGHENYQGAPTDGSAWTTGECSLRVLRGGSWRDSPRYLRSAYRLVSSPYFRHTIIGFRLARTLGP
jgi:formylglycine-generating enzyme required for sulfatase activity